MNRRYRKGMPVKFRDQSSRCGRPYPLHRLQGVRSDSFFCSKGFSSRVAAPGYVPGAIGGVLKAISPCG